MGECPTCRRPFTEHDVPPEPPVGTWVKDRHGASHYRRDDGWAHAPIGWAPYGRWEAMWRARGPLLACGPYGEDNR